MTSDDSRALLTLMLTPGLGQTLVRRCVEAAGSAPAALGMTAERLGRVQGISASRAGTLKRALDETARGDGVPRELEACHAAGVRLLHLDEPGYPRLLRLIPDPPLLLWVRGEMTGDDALAVGLVGSRRCSAYGREQAERFGARCADAGLCVVSGGAYGVDIAAHRAALRVRGRTTAVIGSGLNRPYPAEHAETFDRIVGEGAGAVLSELPMHAGPRAENFPRRNRIISGLSLGVLVIEAARRSGALITARVCVDDHGRECMAVPGRIDSPASAGCHDLIRKGSATLVTCIEDVLEQLGEAGELLKVGLDQHDAAARAASSAGSGSGGGGSLFEANLTDTQRRIVDLLDTSRSLDDLVAGSGLTPAQVQADLTLLEIRGTIKRRGGLFVRHR